MLWGASIPADVDFASDADYFNSFKTYYVTAGNDEFISPAEADAQQSVLQKGGVAFERISFEGKHEIHQPTLLEIAKRS